MSDEQKPVACMMTNNTFNMSPSLHWTSQEWDASWKPVPLYTHPAPDVVKQLVEALDMMERHFSRYDDTHNCLVLDQAKAALAAAKEAGL